MSSQRDSCEVHWFRYNCRNAFCDAGEASARLHSPANTLYPAPLRDLLPRFAAGGADPRLP